MKHEHAAGCARVGGDDGGFDAEFVRRAGLALADAFDLGRSLPSALALLLEADLRGAPQRAGEDATSVGRSPGKPSSKSDYAAEPAAQQAQLPMVALELLGVAITPRRPAIITA